MDGKSQGGEENKGACRKQWVIQIGSQERIGKARKDRRRGEANKNGVAIKHTEQDDLARADDFLGCKAGGGARRECRLRLGSWRDNVYKEADDDA